MKNLYWLGLLVSIFVIAALFYTQTLQKSSMPFLPSITQAPSQQGPTETLTPIPLISIVAKNLEVPWAIAFLPNNTLLVTEREGRLRIIDPKGTLDPTPIQISDVVQIGEGGLHGIAVHPNYLSNHYIYLYHTYGKEGNKILNRVVRYTLEGTTLTDKKVIIDNIPGATFHNGGRIKFGPDNFLYVTTGDAQDPSLAQDTSSLAGKILRVTDDGHVPSTNPFGNMVYSYGHRNPQGLAWDMINQLWSTEHGSTAHDEVNKIEAGKNYGWPTVRGQQTQQGLQTPYIESGETTWAPAGLAYYNGSLLFAGLRGQTLYEVNINGTPSMREYFKNEFGRIREVVLGPDNFLYVTISNRDGRGNPDSDDDKILRINVSDLLSPTP